MHYLTIIGIISEFGSITALLAIALIIALLFISFIKNKCKVFGKAILLLSPVFYLFGDFYFDNIKSGGYKQAPLVFLGIYTYGVLGYFFYVVFLKDKPEASNKIVDKLEGNDKLGEVEIEAQPKIHSENNDSKIFQVKLNQQITNDNKIEFFYFMGLKKRAYALYAIWFIFHVYGALSCDNFLRNRLFPRQYLQFEEFLFLTNFKNWKNIYDISEFFVYTVLPILAYFIYTYLWKIPNNDNSLITNGSKTSKLINKEIMSDVSGKVIRQDYNNRIEQTDLTYGNNYNYNPDFQGNKRTELGNIIDTTTKSELISYETYIGKNKREKTGKDKYVLVFILVLILGVIVIYFFYNESGQNKSLTSISNSEQQNWSIYDGSKEQLLKAIWLELGGLKAGTYNTFVNEFYISEELRQNVYLKFGGNKYGSFEQFLMKAGFYSPYDNIIEAQSKVLYESNKVLNDPFESMANKNEASIRSILASIELEDAAYNRINYVYNIKLEDTSKLQFAIDKLIYKSFLYYDKHFLTVKEEQELANINDEINKIKFEFELFKAEYRLFPEYKFILDATETQKYLLSEYANVIPEEIKNKVLRK